MNTHNKLQSAAIPATYGQSILFQLSILALFGLRQQLAMLRVYPQLTLLANKLNSTLATRN